MLRYIYLLGILTVINAADVANVRVVKTVSSSISSETPADNKFETAHKRQENREFQTAHKITNERPIVKLLDDQPSVDALMQQQNPQNILSTKERPELNPVLSALINEDVMKSIESKRAIEESTDVNSKTVTDKIEAPSAVAAAVAVETATEPILNILTTTEQPKQKPAADDVLNVGLVDRSVNLDEAGSESNQKSRIQIKKGPNGQDYEYEYVYYYYDEDDEKNGKTGSKLKDTTVAGDAGRDGSTRARGRGRSSNSASDVEEGRLPQNTRFPPRTRNGDVTPAPEAGQAIGEKAGRRTGVKRPSLDFIDSDTFNTDEKQVKTNRNIESELNKKTSESADEIQQRVGQDSESGNDYQTTNADSDVENTTPLMEKAALDLYAIIANENFNLDATTGDSLALTTTDLPTTNVEDLTTVTEEDITTTTTTTTPEPTTTTTTTTTAAPAVGGRKGAGGRNRFRLKNGSTTTTTTEAPAETHKTGNKKGRFGGRPSFGSGRTPRPTKEQKDEVKDEVVKEEVKSTSSSLRGRTRNRFNLRGGSGPSTTEKSADENTIESKPISTTARTLRARPQLNLRGRNRPGAATTAPAAAAASSDGENVAADSEKPTSAPASAARPSRFNLGRPAGAGANRLLPRGRINPLKSAAGAGDTTEKKPDEQTTNDQVAVTVSDESVSAVANDEKATTQEGGAPAAGLNRLKSRPKIQVTQKSTKASSPVIVRKPNPLIGRKRIGASSTTESSGNDDGTASSGGDDENVAGDLDDPKDEAASVASEQVVEVSSEQPARSLGLLGNRRRLTLRKPGTVVAA